jgi:hypothetical protein
VEVDPYDFLAYDYMAISWQVVKLPQYMLSLGQVYRFKILYD